MSTFKMGIGKHSLSVKLLFLFIVLLVIICSYMIYKDAILELDKEGLSAIEQLNSGIQRISKLELEDNPDDVLINTLDSAISNLSPINKDSKHFSNDLEVKSTSETVIENWLEFKNIIFDYRKTKNRDELFLVSEQNYQSGTNAVNIINDYIEAEELHNDSALMFLYADIVAIITVLALVFKNARAELHKSKELSEKMYIDESTGIYNRAKCQEILKSSVTPDNIKERAVIVFDLNDLKKTNDSLGHRAGDALIATFAAQLKDGTNAFAEDIFVGRYGGDEFMASFASTTEKNVQRYIKEVNDLMKQLNDADELPFKLSCAAGYAITTASTKSLTMRELFDLADEDMYANKIAMKEKKRLDLLKQGVIEPVVEDDRL